MLDMKEGKTISRPEMAKQTRMKLFGTLVVGMAIFGLYIYGPELGIEHLLPEIIHLGYGIAIIILIYAAFFISKQKYCPKCNAALPKIRDNFDMDSLIHGGWVCPKCSSRVTSKGELVQ
tara:strand:- start:1564 stop:1920 length:357 start_codon:yes stop_codon:yes gene_type:complete